MIKTKISYCCKECGAISSKWQGKCLDCEQWNTFTEIVINDNLNKSNVDRNANYAGFQSNELVNFDDIEMKLENKITTKLNELDRVLGGGLVLGSVVLIGGDPGIGKSTILLQTLANLSDSFKSIYITGEESLQQIKLRATRLDLDKKNKLCLLTETNIEKILPLSLKKKPKVMVLDSIQTMYTNLLQSAPGSVGQVRECCAELVKFAKQNNIAIFLIGHVTKEGMIAGPRILEHMVDTVLYFEGDSDNKFRIIRAYKNRFGAVNEIGIFAMTDKGLKSISNPSAIFLSCNKNKKSGSAIMATKEGTRSMLVEIQALVDESHIANPRRVTVGFEQNRLSMILAVMHKHSGIATYNMDIFINVVGGVKINETAIDLAVFVAIISSLQNKIIPNDIVFFGEIGLSGEIRPVQNGQERLKEAQKLGFSKAIIPSDNMSKQKIKNLKLFPVKNIVDVVDVLRDFIT